MLINKRQGEGERVDAFKTNSNEQVGEGYQKSKFQVNVLFEWPIRWWLHTLLKLSGLFNYMRIEYVVLIATVTHNYLDTHSVIMYMS